MKRPAFQFYPADWRRDVPLQSCSLGARGMWLELMCIMHESEPYGHLTVNGKAMSDAQAARMCGSDVKAYRALLGELDDAGVPSRTAEGVMYSRRMVRDETARSARAEGGASGGSHGAKGGEYGHNGGRPKAEKLSTRGVINPPSDPPNNPPHNPPHNPPSVAENEEGRGVLKPPSYPPPAFASASKVKNNGVEVTTVPSVDGPNANPLTPIFETKQGEKQGKTFEMPAKMLTMPSGWRTDDRATDQAGRLLGLTPGTFESYSEFRRRIAVTYEAHRLAFFGLRQTPENDRSSGDENRAE